MRHITSEHLTAQEYKTNVCICISNDINYRKQNICYGNNMSQSHHTHYTHTSCDSFSLMPCNPNNLRFVMKNDVNVKNIARRVELKQIFIYAYMLCVLCIASLVEVMLIACMFSYDRSSSSSFEECIKYVI